MLNILNMIELGNKKCGCSEKKIKSTCHNQDATHVNASVEYVKMIINNGNAYTFLEDC